MPAPRHGEQTCLKHDRLAWCQLYLRGRESQELSLQRAMALRQTGPFPGRVWVPPASARSHTQSSLYGNEVGWVLAVSATGKSRFGVSPRAQPGLCLDFALSALAGLVGYTASRTHASPAGLSEAGCKGMPQRTAGDMHPAPNATHIPYQRRRTYYTSSDGITVEPAVEEVMTAT